MSIGINSLQGEREILIETFSEEDGAAVICKKREKEAGASYLPGRNISFTTLLQWYVE